MDLALNSQKRLICYKTQTTNQKAKLVNQSVSIIIDKTTNDCDQSILNVIASICEESFLIDVTLRE